MTREETLLAIFSYIDTDSELMIFLRKVVLKTLSQMSDEQLQDVLTRCQQEM